MLTSPGDIIPGQLYRDVAFTDARGDTVEIRLNGPAAGNTGFTVSLAGGAVNNADVNTINLLGVTGQNGLVIRVTPNPCTVTGGSGYYAQMFSAGYVDVAAITAKPDPNVPSASVVTDLGGIQLSAAVVNSIELPGVKIGNITLDAGEVPYVDRVNAASLASISVSAPGVTVVGNATLQEVIDESPVGEVASYEPCTGLIDLNDVEAASIDSLSINGASAPADGASSDANSTTNDFQGTITVAGQIGALIGPNGAFKATLIAGGVGSADLGSIAGTITTTDPTLPLTITLPKEFSGFLNVAGHLNLAYPQQAATQPSAAATTASSSTLTGRITSGGGISGVDPSSTADPIYVPDQYPGVVLNTSASVGISHIKINGSGSSQWYSASDVGDVDANSFAATFIVKAGGKIGDVQSHATDIAGHFEAVGDIGAVTAAANIAADLMAGGSIGQITGITGGLTANVVTAGGNITGIKVMQIAAGTTHVDAGGDIGEISMPSGQWGAKVRARNIGKITDASGNFTDAVFVATGTIGDVTVTAKAGDAIAGGSIIAGVGIGQVAAYAFEGTALKGVLIQAGGQAGGAIAGVTGISYGATTLPGVTAGTTTTPADTYNGIEAAQILAAKIGPVLGRAHVGTGIKQAVIHSQVGDIASITGIGNGDGIRDAIVVAEGGIGTITGQSTVQGAGIYGGSFDANGKSAPETGTIGQVTAQGGPAGGEGIKETRLQASFRIDGIDGTANANGGDALHRISTYATSYGPINATVLGGQTGNGIYGCNIKAWSDYTNGRPDVQIESIRADVRSALGCGITGTIVAAKGDLVAIWSRALGASAIYDSSFSLTKGDFGRIYAEAVNGGSAIHDSLFTASDGSITSAIDASSALASGIVARADASSATAHAINGSTFMADGNIGFISASANGGTAILNSSFTADSDCGNPNDGPNLPGTSPAGDGDLGAVLGIGAETAGQYLLSSAGISGSTFEGEVISSVGVKVTDREEGGPGITGSTFTARNAVYDGNGNFNNRGKIGPITVTNGSLRGDGIDASRFIAGAGGSIGDINVTTLGGVGINNSTFSASGLDYDQSEFDSKIGNINVTTGRSGSFLSPMPPPPNDAWTLGPAGISMSYFAANGGIGDLKVNSIGTGVFASAFLGNFATQLGYGLPGLVLPFLAPSVEGDLGNISVTSTGRFGAGSVFSIYAGTNIGNIKLQVASRDPNGAPINLPDFPGVIGAALNFVEKLVNFTITNVGPAASAGSLFVATKGDIGSISAMNTGPGASSLLSAYVALPMGSYGPVSNVGPSMLNLYWAFPRLFGPGGAQAVTATSLVLPAPNAYKANDLLNFQVNFSGSVTVTGQPSFPVQIGPATRYALYESGSGTSSLLFRLTVDPGDSGTLAVASGTTIQADINNRVTATATGAEVTALTPAVGSTGPIVVDTATPTVTAVSGIARLSNKTGKYAVGEVLTVTVTFSEAVYVTGTPSMALTIGKLTRSLAYSGGSGTNVLTFTYKIVRADVQAGSKASASGRVLLPSGARITDLAGNQAVLPAASASVGTAPVSGRRAVVGSRHVAVRKALPTPVPLSKRAIVSKRGLTAASKAVGFARP